MDDLVLVGLCDDLQEGKVELFKFDVNKFLIYSMEQIIFSFLARLN